MTIAPSRSRFRSWADEWPRWSVEFVEWQEDDGLSIPEALHDRPWERTADGGRRKDAGVRYAVSGADFDAGRPGASLFEAPAGAVVE